MKIAVLLPAIALLACSSSAAVQQGPSDTLRAYSQALEQGRVDDAYRLLSDEAKRSMSLEAFRRAVNENPGEVREIAQAIARPASDPMVMATVTLPEGNEILLVYEGGRWRIDDSAIDLYGQATPRQALQGFLLAFQRGRYDVIMRYVPDAEKEGFASLSGEPSAAVAEPSAPSAPAAPAAPADPSAPAPKAPAASKGAEATLRLTPEKLKQAWEGPQREQITRIVQAIKAALPTATIEETGDSAAMAYGAGGTVAFVREHGVWKIKDF